MAGAEREERAHAATAISVAPSAPVRLSHQSIRDLRFCRSLARGEGRVLQLPNPDLALHSDAADVEYGRTLGTNMAAGSPGSWVAQGFWTAAERAKSITLCELRAVRLLISRSFVAYVSDRRVRRLLVHEDTQAVVYILNSMVSASPAIMAEPRKLQKCCTPWTCAWTRARYRPQSNATRTRCLAPGIRVTFECVGDSRALYRATTTSTCSRSTTGL